MLRHLVLSTLLVTLPAAAIVMRHDRDDARYRELGTRAGVAVIDMNLPGGAGTLISPRWVLTAAHVVQIIKMPHEVIVSGNRIPVRRIIAYPGGGEGQDDLALVELQREVDARPVALYRGSGEADRVVTFAGRGMSGDGVTGPGNRDGVLRAGTNKVEKVRERWLIFHFDAPPAGTDLEAISGPGDSGGPAFIEEEGRLVLAGVSSSQDSRAVGKEGIYGVDEYYVRVSKYLDWIDAAMKADCHE